jgi:membrane associated rhomboid family serine protease
MNTLRRPFRYSNNNISFYLIGINILVYLGQVVLGRNVIYYYLAMIPSMVVRGWVWTFVTYMFVHGGISHILFNMLALFIFGTQVERRMGSKEFLLFYLLTGTLAGFFSFLVYFLTGTGAVLMGASGAIFAVQLAYAVFYPGSIIFIWGILPLRAPVMVLGFTALEIFFSVTGFQPGVAHLTHLAGFAFAWIYFLARFGVNPWREMRR